MYVHFMLKPLYNPLSMCYNSLKQPDIMCFLLNLAILFPSDTSRFAQRVEGIQADSVGDMYNYEGRR